MGLERGWGGVGEALGSAWNLYFKTPCENPQRYPLIQNDYAKKILTENFFEGFERFCDPPIHGKEGTFKKLRVKFLNLLQSSYFRVIFRKQ